MSIFAGEILWNISIPKEREALPGLDKPGAAMFFGEKSLFCWWLIPRNGLWWPFFLFKRDHYCWWLTQFFVGHWIVLFVGHPQLFLPPSSADVCTEKWPVRPETPARSVGARQAVCVNLGYTVPESIKDAVNAQLETMPYLCLAPWMADAMQIWCDWNWDVQQEQHRNMGLTWGYQSINESVNQSINQSFNQPMNQSSASQSIDQSVSQSINQSVNQSINISINQHIYI